MLSQMQRRMSAVLKISSSQLLCLIEIIVVSVGIALFFFFQNRKLKSSHNDSQESAEKMQKELTIQSKKKTELSEWKAKFENLQQKFDRMKEVNGTLKEFIRSIMPESAGSENMQQLLSDMDLSRNDLDACISGLKTEMKDRGEQITSNKKQGQLHEKELKLQKEEITHLKRKLKDTVKKAEFDSIQAEKNRLVIRVEQVEKQLKQKTEEFKKMEKEHMWLEKEYNAMYNNVDEEHEESLNQAEGGRSSKG